MDLCDLWNLCEIKRIIKLSFHDCHLKESLIRENPGDPGALLFPRGDLQNEAKVECCGT